MSPLHLPPLHLPLLHLNGPGAACLLNCLPACLTACRPAPPHIALHALLLMLLAAAC